MTRDILTDLKELVSIISSEQDLLNCIDILPLENAINEITISGKAFYDIKGLTFRINKKIKKANPDVDKISIILNNKVSYINSGTEISIGDYNLDLLIYGFKQSEKYQFYWHLDKHITKGKDRYSHPVFHFQAGGNLASNVSSIQSNNLYIGSPRISHPPMDIFLAINFILNNFYDNKTYGFVKTLLNDIRYREIIKRAQSRIIDPYFNGIVDPHAHRDYKIETIFPTYIKE